MTVIANSISVAITNDSDASVFSGEIIDVTPPSASRESLKVSHQGTSVANSGFHTFIPATFIDWGEFEMTVHYNPSLSTLALRDGALYNVVVTFPEGETHTFTAFLTGYKPASGALDTVMTATLTLKVTGEIAIA